MHKFTKETKKILSIVITLSWVMRKMPQSNSYIHKDAQIHQFSSYNRTDDVTGECPCTTYMQQDSSVSLNDIIRWQRPQAVTDKRTINVFCPHYPEYWSVVYVPCILAFFFFNLYFCPDFLGKKTINIFFFFYNSEG